MQVAGIDLSDRLRSEEQATQHRLRLPGALSCPYVSLFVPANPNAARPVGGIRAGHAYAFPYAPYLHLSCALHTQTSCCGWQLLHQWGHTYKIIKQSFLCYFFGRFSFQKQKACFLFCNSAGSPGPNADTGCTWAGSLSGVGHSKVNLVVTHIQLIHHMNT